MQKKLMRKLFSEKGQALIEYVLIVSLISLATIGALTATGTSVNGMFSNVAEQLGGEGGGTGGGGETPAEEIATEVTLSCDQYYYGQTITPVLSVKANGSAISEGTDFDVEYSGIPTPATEGTDLSWTVTANVTFKGSYASAAPDSAQATIARQSYTVSYNANNGSGAPASQTKYYGIPLTLSSTAPTRNGYGFPGWATSSTADTATYKVGGSYTDNRNITLYAVWKTFSLPSGTVLYKDYDMTQKTTDPFQALVAEYTTSGLYWGGYGTDQSGITNYATGYDATNNDKDGLANTDWILNNTSLGTTNDTIWKFCKDMRDGTGDIKWHVPAAGELRDIYPGTVRGGAAWTSSEADKKNAYLVDSGGYISPTYKVELPIKTYLFRAP